MSIQTDPLAVPLPSVGQRAGPGEVYNLAERYAAVRAASEKLCEPLVTEDHMLQSMPDASPTRWHLAHTTWFFETFVLTPYCAGYRPHNPLFAYLFNSYYNAAGPRWPRPERGLLSRPTVAEIFEYRRAVDDQMRTFLKGELSAAARSTVILGFHHEQQHQELMLTDLKHAWAINPVGPVYRPAVTGAAAPGTAQQWLKFPEGLAWIGHDEGAGGFAFDNESPRHRVFLQAFGMASRLVTNREYLAFMADDGYRRPELWLSEGWNTCQARQWAAPLYWAQREGVWNLFTLAGWRPMALDEPVCHVSYFEADAFARWAGARLPTEAEWETAAGEIPITGHFVEGGHFHPVAGPSAGDTGPLHQLYGDVWQWTASPYVSYPGFRPAAGALGEYNGKFMCNQFVLRGASCATPGSHARPSYRNFFPPDARWQFTGIRLAREAS